MIIYKGYYYFKKTQGSIWLLPLGGNVHGILGSLYEEHKHSFVIQINSKDNLKRKVLSVLHEFAHIGLEYELLTNPERDHPVIKEETIEEIAKKFYERNPPFIQIIKEKLLK